MTPTDAQISAALDALAPTSHGRADVKAALTAAAEVGNKGKCVNAHMGGKRCIGKCMSPKDCCETPLPAAEVGSLREADMIIRRMDEDESWLWPDDLRDAVSRSLGRSEAAEMAKNKVIFQSMPDGSTAVLTAAAAEEAAYIRGFEDCTNARTDRYAALTAAAEVGPDEKLIERCKRLTKDRSEIEAATIERCAQVAEAYFNDPDQYVSRKIAAAIRALKDKE